MKYQSVLMQTIMHRNVQCSFIILFYQSLHVNLEALGLNLVALGSGLG